ncbi:MAG: NAD-dependent epimerase/dehydratase family protein, partial [Planctomycetota bacterium]
GHFSRIYHLASPASPPAYRRLAVETLRCNSEGTQQLLERARRDGALFLFASTSEVYGDPLVHPQPESYWGHVNPNGPRSMYDEAKRYAEALTSVYRERHGVDTRIIRIFNTYGPRMDPADGRVISNFICQALRGERLTIYGDGSQTRSFQFIDDLLEGILRLSEVEYHEPVNLGNQDEYTIAAIARIIREQIPACGAISHQPLPGDDPKQRRPDISTARALLDWQPRIGLSEGLSRTIAYFQNELAVTRPTSRSA